MNDSPGNRNPPHPRLDTAMTPLTFPLSPPTVVTSGPTEESSIAQEQTIPVRTGAARSSQKNSWRPQGLEEQGQGNKARNTDGLRQQLPVGPETTPAARTTERQRISRPPPSLSVPNPIPFFVTSSLWAQAEISCWTKVQAYHQKFSP